MMEAITTIDYQTLYRAAREELAEGDLGIWSCLADPQMNTLASSEVEAAFFTTGNALNINGYDTLAEREELLLPAKHKKPKRRF
ncbi:MAG TPA: hypothetical protein VJI32_01475 [Candidatus Nanoarchaeia archaeon]|nr:hypothetical protein [Candidatus Nanoarchaeia archaeon]